MLKDSYATDADGQIIDLAVWDGLCSLSGACLSIVVVAITVAVVMMPALRAAIMMTLIGVAPVVATVMALGVVTIVAAVVAVVAIVVATIMSIGCGYVANSTTSCGAG